MHSLFSDTMTLILVMDPLGNIPVLLTLLNQVPPHRRLPLILRENIIAFVILVIFLFFGKMILLGFGITQASLRIAGGIILFLIALKMIFPETRPEPRDFVINEPFIVPIAIPMIAGPSAIATVILFGTQTPTRMGLLFFSLCLASLISTGLLLLATPLRNLLGARGLMAMERLMGMILTTLAVQMFLNGIEQFFNFH